jgi:hypothetical protein
MSWFEVEYILLKTLRLQPSELDHMEFYRAEILLEIHKEKTEEENKRRKKQEDQQGANMPNMSGFMGQQKAFMGNLTKGGGPKPPKF